MRQTASPSCKTQEATAYYLLGLREGLVLNEAAGVIHAEFVIILVGVIAVVRTDKPPVHEPRAPVVNDILASVKSVLFPFSS